ncbi:MAG: PAS domain S-box protein [Proteobacteria bacterium]|nr:PAS domain S-box protein [Pseudomonadota bacterium]MBU1059108.1 PAS domain S-box protein [Pseudomonadota bacterium]
MTAKTIHFEPKLISDLLDIIHNAIIVINSDNQIVFTNSRTAEMFGVSITELKKSDFFNLFMPDDKNILVANILHIIRNEREFEGEAMLRRPDGTSFMGMISGTYFQWDNNQWGMAFAIHDLTALKAIEHSLRCSERIAFLGRLIDNISHQIRNPVMVIGGLAKRLDCKGSSSKKVETIRSEANRLEQLLDTLNNFISLRCPMPERLPMTDLIGMAETTLRHKVEAYGCKWISEYDKELVGEDLLFDKGLMLEALETIIINACEAYHSTAEEKIVLLQITHSNDPALPYVINITDYGIGIPRDTLQHVFGHFYSSKTKHIGMGLTLAQKIVEEQRGTLTVSSEAGEGTTVSLHLVKERRRLIRTTRLEQFRPILP